VNRAEAGRLTAEEELAGAAAAKAVADAALKKSENELKTAQANAAAEHDRKLRMYRRAESSRAEMLELQRAERALAMEEAGLSPTAEAAPSADADAVPAEGAQPAETNAVVSVAWPEPEASSSPATAKLAKETDATASNVRQEQRRHARDYVATFGAMIDRANREGRPQDAAHYGRMLMTFVPDYATVYIELVDEARAAGRDEDALRSCAALMALEPDWKRVGTMVRLLERNEGYYSRALAGITTKDEYVKAFKRLYDEARRSTADRDEREAAMERLCRVLATYVPDFEKSSEWK
jgi:hypothetical protein